MTLNNKMFKLKQSKLNIAISFQKKKNIFLLAKNYVKLTQRFSRGSLRGCTLKFNLYIPFIPYHTVNRYCLTLLFCVANPYL